MRAVRRQGVKQPPTSASQWPATQRAETHSPLLLQGSPTAAKGTQVPLVASQRPEAQGTVALQLSPTSPVLTQTPPTQAAR